MITAIRHALVSMPMRQQPARRNIALPAPQDSFTRTHTPQATPRFGTAILLGHGERYNEMEKMDPDWFAKQGLKQGIATYCNQLEALFEEHKAVLAPPNGVITQPSTLAGTLGLAGMLEIDKAQTHYLALHLDPHFEASRQPEEKPSGSTELDLKDPMGDARLAYLAEGLHRIILSVASHLAKPQDALGSVPLERTVEQLKTSQSRLTHESPAWYRQQGLAKAIATYFGALTPLLDATHPLATMTADTETATNAKLLTSHQLKQITQAQAAFTKLSQEDALESLRFRNFDQRVAFLGKTFEHQPESLEALAHKLFEIYQPMIPFIAEGCRADHVLLAKALQGIS